MKIYFPHNERSGFAPRKPRELQLDQPKKDIAMNTDNIPMTAPTLVPVSLSVFRADLLDAASFFIMNPATADNFQVLVGDNMLRKAVVAGHLGLLAGVFREVGDMDLAEQMGAQIECARTIIADGDATPGRKLIMLKAMFDAPDNERLAGFVPAAEEPQRLPTAPQPAPATELLVEALEALQHMTLGQLRAHRISPTLLDRLERAVNQ